MSAELRRLLGILGAELVFGTITYQILLRPYNGEIWLGLLFWQSLAIAGSAFALNIIYGLQYLKKPALPGKKWLVILFCINLIVGLVLVGLYLSEAPTTAA